MTTLLDTTVNTVRRTRRAYLGALGLSYEFALKRAELRMSQAQTLFGDLVERGEAIESDAAALMGRAKSEAEELIDGAKAKFASEAPAAKAKAKTNAKPAAKKTTVKRKPSAKTRVKTIRTTDVPATAAEVAKAPKGKSLDDMTDALQAHVERVQKYDSMANPAMVAKIVTHLGIALQNRDTKYVACTDEAERETVAKSWLTKKLGLDADAKALDAKVGAVCEIMKADRMKDRVTFYYLLAKNENKLGEL